MSTIRICDLCEVRSPTIVAKADRTVSGWSDNYTEKLEICYECWRQIQKARWKERKEDK